MATGLEVAGLALAIFPVVIQSLQFYAKSLQETKKWWRYSMVARGLLRDLEMERTKFENSCEELLFEVADSAELNLLLAHPNGPQWQETHLQIALKSRLGKSFSVFLETVTAIQDTLQDLQARLQRAIPGEVDNSTRLADRLRLLRLSLTDENTKSLLQTLTKHNSDLGLLLGHRKRMAALNVARPSIVTRQLSAFREKAKSIFDLIRTDLTTRCQCAGSHTVCLRLETRCDLEAGSDEQNIAFDEKDILQTLFILESDSGRTQLPWCWRHIAFKSTVSGTVNSSAVRSSSSSTSERERKREIDEASSTLSASGVSLMPSDAALHVRKHPDKHSRLRQHVKKYIKKVSFSSEPTETRSVTLTTSDVEAIESQSIPSTISVVETIEPVVASQLQELEGLCKVARMATPPQELIRLVDESTNTQHEVHVRSHVNNRQPLSFRPLSNAIGAPSEVDRKTTLMLAITLTATVLQLHGTPWLSDSWSNRDMMLPDIQGVETSDEILHQPYICKVMTDQQDETSTAAAGDDDIDPSAPQVRNMCLFSLGSALIEIWFGQTMDELRAAAQGKNKGTALREEKTLLPTAAAFQLIDRVYRQAGDWYGDAVRRCLYCDFNQRHTDLGHGLMKEAVFNGVMVPLTQHLRALCGGSLRDVKPLSFEV